MGSCSVVSSKECLAQTTNVRWQGRPSRDDAVPFCINLNPGSGGQCLLAPVQMLDDEQVLISFPEKSSLDTCKLPLGIRVALSAGHSPADITSAAAKLMRTAEKVVREG